MTDHFTIPDFLRREPGAAKPPLSFAEEQRRTEQATHRRAMTSLHRINSEWRKKKERRAKARSAAAKALAKIPMHFQTWSNDELRVVACGEDSPRKATEHEDRVTCKKCLAAMEGKSAK